MANLPTRPLGDSGLNVSVVGLGCNNFGRRVDLDGTRAVVDAAIAEGVTFFDTSNSYGDGHSEEFLGDVLQGRRDQVVLATKFGWELADDEGPRGARAYIMEAINDSLRRLRTDFVDYYWYHKPDGVTPIAETLGALHELVKAGKVRAIGASNFSAAQLEEADAAARENGLTRFTAVQNQYSLLVREAEHDVLPTCERLGIGFVPYFPLASGLLTGKYRRGEVATEGRLAGRAIPAEQFDRVEALTWFAEERGVSLLDVAVGGLAAMPAIVSVIAGATTPEQVRANVKAGGWIPSESDLDALRKLR